MANKILYGLLMFFIVHKASSQPIPDGLKSCLVYLYGESPSGEPLPMGTGFYVGVKSKKDTTGYIGFLVTAKHVILKQDGTYLNEMLLRINTKDSVRFVSMKIRPTGPNTNTFFHADTSVDLVVIGGTPTKKDYDLSVIPLELFLNRDEYKNVTEGTEVFFGGLFTPFVGIKKNYPIFRFGHISLVTDEKILFAGKYRELAIIESLTYGGNSGSPVFFKMYSDRFNWQIKLGGLINGYFSNYSPVKVLQTNNTPVSENNIGIAGVTPVYLIQDILNGKDVQQLINRDK